MLPTDFFQQPTLDLARDLLGRDFVRHLNGVVLKGRIVEVEAYHQDGDQAAHSYSGKTKRNQVMFTAPGALYVYFIYRMHFCMNVVSEAEGVGAAVLIRAIEPLQGVDEMQRLRGDKVRPKNLTNGPARACQALAINRDQDGASLLGPELYLEVGEPPGPSQIVTGPRIGITKSVDLPWRFCIKGHPYLSKPC